MEKPIYKYATLWGVLAGTGLAFLYLKTLGKDKGLELTKTLLIGASIGAGLGVGFDLAIGSKPKPVTEANLKAMAKSISPDAEKQLDNYLTLADKVKLSEIDNQKIRNVLHGLLLAKKDNKWDEGADIETKKKILLSYGVTQDDFQVFQDILVSGLSDVISLIFKNKVNTEKKSNVIATKTKNFNQY